MQVLSVSQSTYNPASNSESMIKGLERQKNNILKNMETIKNDKSMDEKTKQDKIKKLQEQMQEIDNQIQKMQLEKITEQAKKVVETSQSSSPKTAEEKKKDASVAMDRSLISASTNKDHLTSLGAMRARLINEDGGISERVKRTEKMMSERTAEINKALKDGAVAMEAYTASNKKITENELAEQAEKNKHAESQVFKNDDSSEKHYIDIIHTDDNDTVVKGEKVETNNDKINDSKVQIIDMKTAEGSSKTTPNPSMPKAKDKIKSSRNNNSRQAEHHVDIKV